MREVEISYSDATLIYASKVLKSNCKKQQSKGGCKKCLFYDNGCIVNGSPFCWPCNSNNEELEIEKRKNGQLRKKLHEKKQECHSLRLKLNKMEEGKNE